MSVATLNLGILAHVDAGKTSLTERLLFEHGAIRRLGSVDAGNTTTDSGEIERERGITIRSAVAAFDLGELHVNLVDTPGHPDFIAEVERALSVLDGVVLVVSAVEGVQAQTKVLMRSLQRMKMPTLIFVNKIDRMGARTDALLAELRQRLTPHILPINTVRDAGGPTAAIEYDATLARAFRRPEIETIADNDEALMLRFLEDKEIDYEDFEAALALQTRRGQLHPVYFGSALVGIGIDHLTRGIKTFLPATPLTSHDDRPPAGAVFAIERSYVGDKIAYVRIFEGMLKERQPIAYAQREADGQIKEHTGTISALELAGSRADGAKSKAKDQEPKSIGPGSIAKVRGMSEVRVGARLGDAASLRLEQHFPPPSLEAIVHAKDENKKAKLHNALIAMTDEDPLIQARLTEDGGLSIQLYGEVQKEVITERLQREYGLDIVFSETQPVYFERPIGTGAALHEYDTIHVHDNAFPISIGIRVEPNTIGAGNRFVREAKWGLMPAGFYRTIEESAIRTLSQGLYGWRVTDCIVYLTLVAYERPLTVAAHFRHLTSILVLRALQEGGCQVFEPYNLFELDVPSSAHGSLIAWLTTQGAEVEKSEQSGPNTWRISGMMPARLVQEVTREIPGLTNGEGMLTSYPGADQPVRGKYPQRARTDGNPLDYDNFMKYLSKHKLL